MKILLSAFHNPNFVNTVVYRERAIEALGHKLIRFDDRKFLLPGRLREKVKALQMWDLKRLNCQLVNLAEKEKPELFMSIGGQRILPETIVDLKALGIKTALWTTDVPIDFENILKCSPIYDHVFCAGTEAMDIFEENGLKSARWIPFGCDPEFHKPVSLSEDERKKYARDIIFVGSYYPNRAKLLESLADFNIGIWGPYWSKLDQQSPLQGKIVESKLNFDEWIKIYSAAKIVIVVHYQNPKIPCHQVSPKLFEAMACKCFVMTDSQKDAKALFTDGQHVIFFENEKDLREKVKYFLQQDDARRSIALQGYKEAIAHHTYQGRFQKMFSLITDKV